jgi:hypothetical protein
MPVCGPEAPVLAGFTVVHFGSSLDRRSSNNEKKKTKELTKKTRKTRVANSTEHQKMEEEKTIRNIQLKHDNTDKTRKVTIKYKNAIK